MEEDESAGETTGESIDGAAGEHVPSDSRRTHESGRPSAFAVVLAVGWLLIPATQYLGTVQRTEYQLEGSAPFESLDALAERLVGVPLEKWDLIPLYLALLAATFVFAALQVLARRRAEPQP